MPPAIIRLTPLILAAVLLAPGLSRAADAEPPAEPVKAAPAKLAADEPGKTDPSTWDKTKTLFSTIWNEGRQELYIPGYTWHNPSTYSQAQRDGYTTYAAGIGYGRTWTSDSNNDHGLYAMEFQDSHNDIQPVVGYYYMWMWGKPGDLRAGVGVTAFITARYDTSGCQYCPFPAALPIASVSFWRLSIMGTYVPKFSDRGNVAFLWGKFAF
jgi:palmitoyl transferase